MLFIQTISELLGSDLNENHPPGKPSGFPPYNWESKHEANTTELHPKVRQTCFIP